MPAEEEKRRESEGSAGAGDEKDGGRGVRLGFTATGRRWSLGAAEAEAARVKRRGRRNSRQAIARCAARLASRRGGSVGQWVGRFGLRG